LRDTWKAVIAVRYSEIDDTLTNEVQFGTFMRRNDAPCPFGKPRWTSLPEVEATTFEPRIPKKMSNVKKPVLEQQLSYQGATFLLL